MSDEPLTEKVTNAVSYRLNKVSGAAEDLTISGAKKAAELTGGNISEDQARGLIPLLVGGAAAGTGYLLLNPLRKVSQLLARGLRKVVTGFGLFEKIPVLGGAFTAVGELVESAGNYGAHAATAIGALIGYKMFSINDMPVEESVRGPYDATGRAPNAPEKKTAEVVDPKTGKTEAKEEVPVRPAPEPELPDAVKEAVRPLDPDHKTRAEIRAAREQAIRDKNEVLDKAIGEYMGRENQVYENTRAWIDEADKFRIDRRHNLVLALEKSGLSIGEAEALVPKPPVLQKNVYSDGKDFKPVLVAFAQDFEKTYGQGGPDVRTMDTNEPVFMFRNNKGGTPRRIKWDDMSVTQREEFLDKALRFVEQRRKFFEGKYKTIPQGETAFVRVEDNADPAQRTFFNSLFGTGPEGENYGMKWSKEREFLNRTFDIRSSGAAQLYVPEALEEHKKNWADHEVAADRHKNDLKDAEPQIQAFTAQVQEMEKKLDIIKAHGVAVLSAPVQGVGSEKVMEVRDLASKDNHALQLVGVQDKDTLSVREVRNAATGQITTLDKPVEVNVKTYRGVATVVKQVSESGDAVVKDKSREKPEAAKPKENESAFSMPSLSGVNLDLQGVSYGGGEFKGPGSAVPAKPKPEQNRPKSQQPQNLA